MTQAFAEQMEQARDLRTQLTGLEQGDEREMLFQEWSPGRKMIKLWSLIDGQEIVIPKYMVLPALNKKQPNGKYVFTAKQEDAPAFKNGNVRCFLAEGSPERESGLLDEAGLSHLPLCPADGLRSGYSKRIHAQNRHRQSWETLQDHIKEHEREEAREEQRKQTAAMLSLAGSREEPAVIPTGTVSFQPYDVTNSATVEFVCDCGFVAKSQFGLDAHKRSHKE